MLWLFVKWPKYPLPPCVATITGAGFTDVVLKKGSGKWFVMAVGAFQPVGCLCEFSVVEAVPAQAHVCSSDMFFRLRTC